jgi:TM2 domain-containing membrane protein YozV
MKKLIVLLVLFVLSLTSVMAMDTVVCANQTTDEITIADSHLRDGDTVLTIIVADTIYKDSNKKKVVVLTDKQKKQKRIAAFFSFPFPLGFLGAHRIVLGTKPWVPIVYVATFGGCFGLLPLVDFCVIMFSDTIEQYENNPNIFMWMK